MEKIADLLTDIDIEVVKTRLEELEELALAHGWVYVPYEDNSIHDVKITCTWDV